ncbi:MAG: choice-of-anchor D domain-containing protein, partial [Desulfuromonadaceae bacterium]|nr:choice-of-anchor D domain-containing protein [Desulfuromonadaceae bacterium]
VATLGISTPGGSSFGQIATGTSKTLSVTLSNSGQAPLNITNISGAVAPFTLSQTEFQILPNGTVTLLVNYTPTVAAGTDSVTLSVVSDSSSGATQTLTLTGSAALPSMSITGTSANTLAFGAANAVDLAVTKSINITNTGSVDYTITSISGLGAPFVVGTLPSFPYTLVSGTTLTVQVVYTPVVAGASSGTLNIQTNSTLGTKTVAVTGTCVTSSTLELTTPSGSSFGNTGLGISSTLPVRLTNTGDGPLTVTNIASSNPKFTVSQNTLQVLGGTSAEVSITYTPTVATSGESTVITVTSNASNGASQTLILAGSATAPSLTANLSTLAFGNVQVGDSKGLSVVLANTGNTAVSVNAMTVAGSSDFTLTAPLDSALPINIPVGASQTFTLQYTPTVSGVAAATSLDLTLNGGTLKQVPLSGTGIAVPLISVTQSATGLNFGTIALGTSKLLALDIKNTGNAPLNITGITSNNINFKLPAGLAFQILPNGTQQVIVTYTPTVEGYNNSTITVASDASNTPSLPISATGTAIILTVNSVGISPSPITFSSTPVGSSQTINMLITNNSPLSVKINAIDLPQAPFTLIGAPTLPLAIPAGEQTSLQLKFEPTDSGSFSTSMGVLFDYATVPQIVNISGTATGGTQVSLGNIVFKSSNIQTSSVSFGNVYKGSVASKIVRIENIGSGPITINSVSVDNTQFRALLSTPITLNVNSGLAGATGYYKDFEVDFIPTALTAAAATLTLKDIDGATFSLNLSGAGIPVDVKLNSGSGVLSSITSLSSTQLPMSYLSDKLFTVSSAADFSVTGVTVGDTVNVDVTFATLPANPIFYKVVGNTWYLLREGTDYQLNGNTITYSITDDGIWDADNSNITGNDGVIHDPIVVGSIGTGTNTTTTQTSTNIPPASGGGGGGCFIATAAYGSYLDPHVMVLRHFRDDVLLKSELGTEFVKFYYKHSPPIADFIYQHEVLRMLFRFALTPLIFGAEYPLVTGMIFVLTAVWYIRRRVNLKVKDETLQQIG